MTGQMREFLLGGTATVAACFFTNPMEVVKTRLQLQGELQRSLTAAQRPYKGVFSGFMHILRTEGFRGIQRGLTPACFYQFTMNGTRLGSYTIIQRLLLSGATPSEDRFFFLKNVVAGATAGVLGAVMGSPFFLVKIRMQANTDVPENAVGHQYKYSSVFREEGVRGVMRGVDAAAMRVAIGSAVQLSSYDQCKKLILSTGIENGVVAHLSASLIAGALLVLSMNPFDVVSTRLYNEKVEGNRGALYKGPFDCLFKTVRTEGIAGLYKGTLAHYLRVGPHTILTFVFWEQLKKLAGPPSK